MKHSVDRGFYEMQAEDSGNRENADVQLLKEWNIDRFFSRNDEKRHSTQTVAPGPLERQVQREILAPVVAKDRISATTATPSIESNFMKNFSFIKNFKREKSDLFPLSKRHSSEISYNVNVNKYISAVGPQRNSAMENCNAGSGTGAVLRAGPRREKTESVILRRNSTQPPAIAKMPVGAQQSDVSRLGAARPMTAETHSINKPIDLKSIVAGEGGSRFSADQVIETLLPCGSCDRDSGHHSPELVCLLFRHRFLCNNNFHVI